MRTSSEGITLIQVLVSTAVLAIAAALVWMNIVRPNLLKSKMVAEQNSAVDSLRAIYTAEVTYSTTYEHGYSSSLAQLGPPKSGHDTASAAGLVNDQLSNGTKAGYEFTYRPAPPHNGEIYRYTVNADPVGQAMTGAAHYYVDISGVIRSNATKKAGPSDPEIP